MCIRDRVLASVQLSSPHGGRAVSLQERQAELLRDKIRSLERKTSDMIRHGHENMGIGDKLQGWTFGLLKAADPSLLPTVIARDLALCFDVPQTALRLWDVAPAWATASYAQGCSDDVKAFALSLIHILAADTLLGRKLIDVFDGTATATFCRRLALCQKTGFPAMLSHTLHAPTLPLIHL